MIYVVGQRVEVPGGAIGTVAVPMERGLSGATLQLGPHEGAAFTTIVVVDGEVRTFLDSALSPADEGDDYS